VSGHTPGPWWIKWGFNVFGPDNRLVANAGGHENNQNQAAVQAENVANARLIAAAPDLLTAVLLAADYFERLPQFPDRGVDIKAVTLALRAAIAKAEGK
jgi:hypothetical protein